MYSFFENSNGYAPLRGQEDFLVSRIQNCSDLLLASYSRYNVFFAIILEITFRIRRRARLNVLHARGAVQFITCDTKCFHVLRYRAD